MPSFVRIEIWTDLSCASGARVAEFGPDEMARASLRESLTAAEGLSFVVSRAQSGVTELIESRIARVVYSDTTLDTEWRIDNRTDQSGQNDDGQVTIECVPISFDLSRAVIVDWTSGGDPFLTIDGVQLTATDWLTSFAIPACVEAGMSWVAVGTIEYANLFDLTGDYQTALQLVRAIQELGRAPGEFVLRRNGATDYKIDILTARGSAADTVRVQTARNLLQNVRKRQRSLMATNLVPRGSSDGQTRTMSRAQWATSVFSATQLTLSDPAGGTGPIAFDDQLNGLYAARQHSTFGSQIITASSASTQRITVASTAAYTGERCEFRRTSGSGGERAVSLSHPTRSLAPAAAGYGKLTRFLDVPAQVADNNLVGNPWGRTWAVPTDPPDGWIIGTDDAGTISQESTITRFGIPAMRVAYPGRSLTNPNGYFATGTVYPFTTAGLLHAAHVWVYLVDFESKFRLVVTKPDRTVDYGAVVAIPQPGAWNLIVLTALDLSTATSGVRLAVEVLTPYIDANYIITGFSLSEGADDIPDIEFPGGNVLHQRANVVLADISSPVAGYTTKFADLARLDNSEWGDEHPEIGGNMEIVDSTLGITTTQRMVELVRDLKNPLDTQVTLDNAAIRASEALA